MRTLLIAAAAAGMLFAAPALAAPAASPDIQAAQTQATPDKTVTEDFSARHRRHYRHWRHYRHYGWYRGRHHHYGWRHRHHRHYWR